MTQMYRVALLLAFISLLSACSSRYHSSQDKAPLRAPTAQEMRDARITNEAKSVSAGRPYKVRGKHYTPMSDEQGYKATGTASWYGKKFHGYFTSNGEIFNMFSMSAAHKTLPLPSFVKVTNTANGRSAIVRVNDRGPFHDDRIIDLSYAAAYKLGFHLQGTAQVQIEAITLDRTAPRLTYIQVAAGSKLPNIKELATRLEGTYNIDSAIVTEGSLHKLRLGPITNDSEAQSLLKQLQQGNFQHAFLLYSEQRL